MAKAIGIDLGTTNSVVAFKDTAVRIISTGANNEELCRSCVASRNGSFDVGNHVYNQWRRYAPNIVVSVKRLMGGAISDDQVKKMKADRDAYPYGIKQLTGGTEESVAVVLEGREYTPEQISAEILKRLKEDASRKLNDEVTHAVITVHISARSRRQPQERQPSLLDLRYRDFLQNLQLLQSHTAWTSMDQMRLRRSLYMTSAAELSTSLFS